MIEQKFEMTLRSEKIIEKVIQDENLNYLHMVLPENDGLPEHYTDATLYMTVLKGELSIRINDQENKEYDAGSIIKIPYNTKMNVKNQHEDTLELIVIKIPEQKNH
ncbi:MAG: cupin domain-containing protein [Peptostreptococcaceae bacterium]|nr:cupin domain-containing protein [Peptostreptococcaceae bacterium]